MSLSVSCPMNVEEFLAWQDAKEDRYELVDGWPVLRAPVENLCDHIAINLASVLATRARGSHFRAFMAESLFETYPGRIRRRDVGVEVRPRDADTLAPRLVAEVLARSHRDFESFSRLPEYQSMPTVGHVLYIESHRPEVQLWSRGEGGRWTATIERELTASIDLPAIEMSVPMVEIYDSVTFRVDRLRN